MTGRIPSALTFPIVACALFMAGTLTAPQAAEAAPDPIVTLMKGAKTPGIARAPETLPPPTRNTKPFRQTVFANCNTLLEFGLCKYKFLKVGSNKLLKVIRPL